MSIHDEHHYAKKQQLIDCAVKHFEKLRESGSSAEPEDGLVRALEELDSPDMTAEEYDSMVHSVNSACIVKGIWSSVSPDAPYEYLPVAFLDAAFGDFSACEDKWTGISASQYHVFLAALTCVVKQSKEEITEEADMLLSAGRVLSIPIGFIRKATKERKCPKCGASIFGIGALSRIDNETVICDSCGTTEAMEDYGRCIR